MESSAPKNLADAINSLRPKDKVPNSTRILNTSIAQAERNLGSDGGRLGWLVASTVVAAALQQAVDTQGEPLFLLKGGTLLQHRLPDFSRATTDLDGLVRCDLDKFLVKLDDIFDHPWGPCTFLRGSVQQIDVLYRVVKPLRFNVTVQIRGVTWRRIQVEVSPDEGAAGTEPESIAPPSLKGFGLPSPDRLIGLALSYQIAQKVHAATDPHDPPIMVNDRARDVVDLLFLQDLHETTGHPSLSKIRHAIEDIFHVRALEVSATGGTPRRWPTRLVAYPHWETSYGAAAKSASLSTELGEAVKQVNSWLNQIEQSSETNHSSYSEHP